MSRLLACVLAATSIVSGCTVGGTGGNGEAAPTPDVPSVYLGGTTRELPVGGTIEVRDGKTFVQGKVFRADGSPAAGASVAVAKGGPLAGLMEGVAKAMFGGNCDEDAAGCVPPGAADRVKADGSYSLRLDATSDQYVIGAVLGDPRRGDGPSVQATVSVPEPVNGAGGPVPALRFWEPGVRPTVEGTRVKVDFDVLGDSGYGELDFISLLAWPPDIHAGTQPYVKEDVVKPGDSFDVALTEDAPTELRLSAGAEGTVGGTTVRMAMGSAAKPLVVPRTAPPSRRAACGTQRPDGAISRFAACPLTDGDLQLPFSTPGAGEQPVVVDMGRILDARLVVVHGCAIACNVEVSEDGVAWRAQRLPLVTEDMPIWPTPGRVRLVRLDPHDALAMREVSVW